MATIELQDIITDYYLVVTNHFNGVDFFSAINGTMPQQVNVLLSVLSISFYVDYLFSISSFGEIADNVLRP